MKDLGVWCVYGVLVSLTWMLFTIPTITFFVHVSMDGSSEVSCVSVKYQPVLLYIAIVNPLATRNSLKKHKPCSEV